MEFNWRSKSAASAGARARGGAGRAAKQPADPGDSNEFFFGMMSELSPYHIT